MYDAFRRAKILKIMPNIPTNTQQIEEMRRKLASAQASLDELKSTIELMEKNSISSIEATHVGQMERADFYLRNYATGCRKGYLARLHAKP